MNASPAGAHFQASINHIWSHIKPKADERYLQNTRVIIESDTANNGSFSSHIVDCPAGFQAVGGGVDPNNVLTMDVTASAPMFNGTRTILTADGNAGRADGWFGAVTNNSGSTATYKVAVICSK